MLLLLEIVKTIKNLTEYLEPLKHLLSFVEHSLKTTAIVEKKVCFGVKEIEVCGLAL